jgi:CRP-like cAMP-binding protein
MKKEMLLGFLKGHILFEELIAEELDIVARRLSVQELATGQLLFKEGDNAEFFCLVAQGSLEVIKKGKDGRTAIIATLGDGDSVGEMAVVDGMVRSATVRAAAYSIVIVLQRKDFEKILEGYPRIGAKLLKGIARHISVNLRRTSSELTNLMMPIA